MRRFFAAYWKTLLCAVGIACLSLASVSAPTVPHLPQADKWAHALMYAVLAVAAFVDWRPRWPSKGAVAFLLLLPPVYGGAMELLQEFCTVLRSGDWFDLLADTLGGWLALACCALATKMVKR